MNLEGLTRRGLYDLALEMRSTIELYRKQIAFLRAELERQALMVAVHYTPEERLHALRTEWRVVNSAGTPHTSIFDTLTDAQAWADHADHQCHHDPHHIEYRSSTAWRSIQ